jgi:putative spermidine/putrescine transport system substrate-binding protein
MQSAKGAFGLTSVALLAACGGGGSAAAPTAAPTTAAPTAAPKAAPTAAPAATTAPVAAPTTAPNAAPTTAAGPTAAPKVSGPVTINFYSGGDTNVHDLWANDLLPAYQKANPNIKFELVFDEHGAGDQTTFDRIAAAKQAGKPSGVDIWETDSLQRGGEAGIIEKLDVAKLPNLSKVLPDVIAQQGGYGVPYRGSSVVLAYNSKDVATPPKTLDELLTWIKANPGKFTYNPPDKGGSGSAFVTRVLMMGIKPEDLKLFQTGYDASKESEWDQGWKTLKDIAPAIFNNGFYPQGNVPVLQTLGKGSISVAPVWSDQGLSYLAQKLLPPEVKLEQIDPPFSGGASYIGMPSDSQHKDEVYAFLNWLLTPDPQTVVVNKMNGYPGLDWKFMPDDVRSKYADIAKSYSYGFSSKFGNDRNQQWYEKIAGTPMPKK